MLDGNIETSRRGPEDQSLSPQDPVPSFDPEAIRLVNRAVAGQVSANEHKSLLARHQTLAFKEVTEELSESERRELLLLRWRLDRITDAQLGNTLETIERAIDRREDLAADIARFAAQIRHATASRRRQKRR